MKTTKLILFILTLLSVTTLLSQDGRLDTLFNYEMYNRFYNGNKLYGNSTSREIKTYGNSVYVGTVGLDSYDGIVAHGMIKLHEDGALDTNFINLFPSSSIVNTIEFQSNGKIIVGGRFSSYGSNTVNNLIRLNQDGSLDPTFDIGIGPNNTNGGIPEIEDVEILDNGKIIVVGNFFNFNGVSRKGIVQLYSDGGIDYTFNPGSGFSTIDDAGTKVVAIQDDGKILVGGFFFNYDGSTCNGLARLLPNGNIDFSFSLGAGAAGVGYSIRHILLDEQQRILIGGTFTSYQSVWSQNMCRLDTSGNVDLAFSSGSGLSNSLEDVGLQSDGSYIVASGGSSYNGVNVDRLFRLDSLGNIDPSFDYNDGPAGGNPNVSGLCVLDNDDIVLQGGFVYFDGMFKKGTAKLSKDGELDLSYALSTGINGEYASVRCIEHQPDNKILVGGSFTEYNGKRSGSLVRLFPDGTLDTMFFTDVNNYVYDIEVQSNGRILIGGSFDTINGQPIHGVARLMPDGTTDNSFNIGNGTSSSGSFNYVKSVSVRSFDGRIYVAGMFDSINGEERNSIARLNQDGSVDMNFVSDLEPYSGYEMIQVEALGNYKCLILGPVQTPTRRRIYRLDNNGSLDPSFHSSSFNSALGFGIRNDNKIVAYGVNQSASSSWEKDVKLLDENGYVDNSFDSGDGFNGSGNTPYDMVIQSDDKLVFVGDFTFYDGNVANGIVRVNMDGTIDHSFDANSGFIYHDVYAVDINENYVVAGGRFASYQGSFQNNITRVHNEVCNYNYENITASSCWEYTSQSGEVYTSSGVYTEIINSTFGCDTILSLYLTIDTLDPSVSQVNNVLTAAESGAAYAWLNCQGMTTISGETGQTFTAPINGEYAVVVTNGSCTDTSACMSVTTVSNIEEDLAYLNVYPNPTKGIFNLSLNNEAWVKLTDLKGRFILNEYYSSGDHKIDISNFSEGIYLLKISSKGNIKNYKIIKE